MNYDRCRSCQEFADLDRHTCAPRWLCWTPDTGTREDASPVYAHAPSTAAEKYVDACDHEGDYSCVQGNPQPVHVLREGDPEQRLYVFVVHGEAVPSYSATAVELQAERATCRVHTRSFRKEDGQYWIGVEDLDGHDLGGFAVSAEGDPAPEVNDYVSLDGEIGRGGSRVFWGRNDLYEVVL